MKKKEIDGIRMKHILEERDGGEYIYEPIASKMPPAEEILREFFAERGLDIEDLDLGIEGLNVGATKPKKSKKKTSADSGKKPAAKKPAGKKK